MVLAAFGILLLAGTFAVSVVGKLRSPGLTDAFLREVPLPSQLPLAPLIFAVPAWEALLSAGLVLSSGWALTLAALLSAITFTVFTTAFIWILHKRKHVECACFGELSFDRTVGISSVIRNLMLIGVSLTILYINVSVDPGNLLNMLATLDESGALQLAVLILSVLVIVLAREIHVAKRIISSTAPPPTDPPHSIEMAAPIPDVELVTIDGVSLPLARVGYGKPTLLIFGSAECSSCIETAQQLPLWQSRLPHVAIIFATSSRPQMLRDRAATALPFARFASNAAKQAFKVTEVPAAVFLGAHPTSVIASPVVTGPRQIESLVESIEFTFAHRPSESAHDELR